MPTLTPTVAAPPNTTEVSQQLLASLAALSGIVTDYNKGSQIRTLSESMGSVVEIGGISALAVVMQAIAYSAMSIFDITPNAAVPANGSILFATAFVANPPPAVQDVFIPTNTLMQTLGGVQFQTTQAVTLASGATGVTAPIQGVEGGGNTNVAAGTINQLLTGLAYPVVITNLQPTSGGLDAETATQALSRLASKFTSLIGGSPVSVANCAVGVTASGSSEAVVFSTCYEGWADPLSPNYPDTPGFDLYIDNGSGGASADLIAAVITKLNGNLFTDTPAFRPAGMPNAVLAVQPIFANVSVVGTLGPLSNQLQTTNSVIAAVSGYFQLPFGLAAVSANIGAVVANAALGQLTSLTVDLYYANAPSTIVPAVSGRLFNRVLLNSLSVNLT